MPFGKKPSVLLELADFGSEHAVARFGDHFVLLSLLVREPLRCLTDGTLPV